mmetsp:Transcript_100641/g.285159  ORF Transcript_100641/g.285159 Transcript_100641/m.285159 type:complete len:284 (-) Transcript_100641:259-1110(-)
MDLLRRAGGWLPRLLRSRPGRRRAGGHGPVGFSRTNLSLASLSVHVEVADALNTVLGFLPWPASLAAPTEDNPVHAVRQCPDPLAEPAGLLGALVRVLGLLLGALAHDVLVGREVLRREEGVQDNQLHVQHEEWHVYGEHHDQQPQEEFLGNAPEHCNVLDPRREHVLVHKVVDQQVQTCAKDDADHDGHRGNRDEKGAVVRSAYAVVQPHAVVVERCHALIACPAVLAARVHGNIAHGAVGQVLAIIGLQVRSLVTHVRVSRITAGGLDCGKDKHDDAGDVE